MGLEIATFISDLNPSNPTGADPRSTSDDHFRLVKSTLKNTFPNVTGAVTATHTLLNKVGVTAAPGDSSTAPASTAFVGAALAAANLNGAMSMRTVTAVTATAASGEHVIMTNASQSVLTLPPPPAAGTRVWVTFTNALTSNYLDRNGSIIEGAAGNYYGASGTVKMRFVSAGIGWVLESTKDSKFAAASHTHTSANITNFAAAVAATPPQAHTQTASTITDFTAAALAVRMPQVTVNVASYTVSNADQEILVQYAGQCNIVLPASPPNGRRVRITGINGRKDIAVYVPTGGPDIIFNGNRAYAGEYLFLNHISDPSIEFERKDTWRIN